MGELFVCCYEEAEDGEFGWWGVMSRHSDACKIHVHIPGGGR